MPRKHCLQCYNSFLPARPWQVFCSTRCQQDYHIAERKARANAYELYIQKAKECQELQDELDMTKEVLKETRGRLVAALAELRVERGTHAPETADLQALQMGPDEYRLPAHEDQRTPPQPIKRAGLFR